MDARTEPRHASEPRELMDLCLNCTKPDCKGSCAQYRALRGAEPGKNGPRAIAYPGPGGLVLTFKEWEKRSGIPAKTLYNRVNVCGMTMQQAIEKGTYRGGPSRDERWYLRFREMCRAYAGRRQA